MMNKITEDIIIRSILKETSLEDEKLLNQWLKSDERNIEYYFQLEEVWNSRRIIRENDKTQRRWEMLLEHISLSQVSNQHKSREPRKRISQVLRYIAAIFIGVLVTSTIWYTVYNNKRELSYSTTKNIVYNNHGVQSVILPDQSEIWLNENSRIIYPDKFADNKRVVLLEGNAYFDVSSDLSKPFIVELGKVEIKVLGTEFFVENNNLNESLVTLISGKVSLNYTNEDGLEIVEYMNPGEQANIDYLRGDIIINNIDTDYYLAWKDGTYRFVDESLDQIARIISKHYGVEIIISQQLRSKRFTGRVIPNQSIESVLNSISKTYPIRYQIVDGEIIITE